MALAPAVAPALAAHVATWTRRGAAPSVRHQAQRLLLNALKASVEACDHEVVDALQDWEAEAEARGRPATVLWRGTRLAAESAVAVNAAMLEVLDFNENHTPNGPLHPSATVLPAVLAEAERGGAAGRAVLDALALGIEVELAVATMLGWSTYRRGFMTGVLVGGIGAATACCALKGLDAERTTSALGFAMTAGLGAMENFGSAGHAINTGYAARIGFLSAVWAERGLVTAPTAFEGKKGMLRSVSDETPAKASAVLAALGAEPWARIFELDLKRWPTETITQAPLTCVLDLVARLGTGRPEPERLVLEVNPLVAEIAADRRAQFGARPATDLQARFDLTFCVAAAWCRGRFTVAETSADARADPAVLRVRERVAVEPDPGLGIEAARLEARGADGGIERAACPAFRGSARNPFGDAELEAALRAQAAGRVAPERLDRLVEAVWTLDDAASVDAVLEHARVLAHP